MCYMFNNYNLKGAFSYANLTGGRPLYLSMFNHYLNSAIKPLLLKERVYKTDLMLELFKK